jgi:hypothetical protein
LFVCGPGLPDCKNDKTYKNIVTVDKTWVCGYDLETKQ